MSAKAWEFAFWAIIVTGAATAVILFQHGQHTGAILSALNGDGSKGDDPLTAAANAGPGAGYTSPSPASGIATPLGDLRASAFPYTPDQAMQ